MRLSDYDHMPPVAAVMTTFPYFARPDDPVSRALELMEAHQIRHLPVKDSDRVVGVVSQRDVRWLTNPVLPRPDPEKVRVRDVQSGDPYTVELGTPLSTVMSVMAERKLGTAVVVRSGKLAGIVTVTDVCRALGELLEARFVDAEPTDAA
jgi:CBS domain-containing protein